MSSFNGLKKISATDIQNSGRFYLGSGVNAGTAGQALVSGGPNEPARWDTHTGTIQPLTMGANVSLASGNPDFDGSIPDTLNSVDTTYSAGNGIQISGGSNIIQTKTDNQTIRDSGGGSGDQLEVIKVPNALTAGTNITFSVGTTYDGSAAITINASGGTTYQAGDGIVFDPFTVPESIEANTDGTTITKTGGTGNQLSVLKVPNALTCGANLLFVTGTDYDGSASRQIYLTKTPTGFNSITMSSTPSATTITGNTYPGNPTHCSYLDLTSSTNLIAGGVLATKIQRTTLIKTFTTIYSEFSSNFRTSFVAISPNVMIEFRAIVRCDNRLFYGGLYDYVNLVYHADCRNRFNYNDETDQDFTTITWWMTGLTPGNTYYISPYFRGDINYVYMYVGHGGAVDGYAPAIMRIYDGGNNVNIY